MGDFERTFGAGADAVGIIEGFSRGYSDAPEFGQHHRRRWSPRLHAEWQPDPDVDYDDDFYEVDPQDVPACRRVVFTSYTAVLQWDRRNHRRNLEFSRSAGEEGLFEMLMIGRRPATY